MTDIESGKFMSKKNWVLVDADAMYALTDSKDNNHSLAVKIYQQLSKENSVFVCTNTSYYEILTILSMHAGFGTARQFVAETKKQIQIVFIDQELNDLAEQIFSEQTSKNVSFFDCLNMAVLTKYKLERIFSFDQDYKKNGFKRVEIDG